MSMISGSAINRRALLGGIAGMAATALTPHATRSDQTDASEHHLVAAPGRWPIVGQSRAATDVWCYGGTVPGPTIRLRQGERARIIVRNELAEDTTVHWHGIRLPNAMDGVPGLTQPPIKPGDQFTYEFAPPDAGTFWYHPHMNGVEQLGRGLAGPLIVEEARPVAVDRDLIWMLADWRLTSTAQIAPGFGNPMDAAMSGRLGNTVTINGAVTDDLSVRAGERVRLRLINCALGRIMALRFEGHRPIIVAIDGQPCEPHEPERGRLLLGPAMRTDVLLDMQGEPGRRYNVVDDFYDEMSYWLTRLAYENKPPVRSHPLEAPVALPRNPPSEPDPSTAERHELALQGGMMSGMGMMGGMGMRGGAFWAINGMSMTGDGSADIKPQLTLARGRTCLLTLRNDTAWWHPMHLHGHSFRVLRRNGTSVPHREWADTVLLPPKETVDVAFVADNPGDWMLHCHVADHQASGMMTILRIT